MKIFTIPAPITIRFIGGFAIALLVLIGGMTGITEKVSGQGATAAHAKSTGRKTSKNSARESRRSRLAGVKSWGYQLLHVKPRVVAASPYDLMVVDHEMPFYKRFRRQTTHEEIEIMKQRPATAGTTRSRRILLAYLSIGEAEHYRFYWRNRWYKPETAPSWIVRMNQQWKGNYLVRYWMRDWQNIIFKGPNSYLDRILKQGFDGIYLDRADAFEEFSGENPKARRQMIKFISELTRYARKRNPKFLVVMQNAEELLRSDKIRRAIDGIAKEDLFYGINHAGQPNPADEVEWSLDLLRKGKDKGLKIFTVEYLRDRKLANTTSRKIASHGFVPYIAPRRLDELWTAGNEF